MEEPERYLILGWHSWPDLLRELMSIFREDLHSMLRTIQRLPTVQTRNFLIPWNISR